jgi:FkbM family methyltransferase
MLRSLTRRWLRSRNYDIRRYVTEVGRGLPLLELAVAARCAGGPLPHVLQVGANDGVTADPLRPLICKYQLPGLLIEPMPEAYSQLLQNYAGQSGIRFENCALWHENGEREFFRIRTAAYRDPLIRGMAGLSREVLLRAAHYLPDLKHQIETLHVRTLAPRTLFEKHQLSRVDLLVVDTEGFDDKIVQLVLNAGMIPDIIYFEHVHLGAIRQDALAEFLSARGYQFARTRTDTLAVVHPKPGPLELAPSSETDLAFQSPVVTPWIEPIQTSR